MAAYQNSFNISKHLSLYADLKPAARVFFAMEFHKKVCYAH